jgi:hypothetical protein
VRRESGDVLIWEMPQPGAEYVLGVDVAEGIDGGDYSTIEVLKVPKSGTPIIEQVAEFAALADPVSLAKIAMDLGFFYNEGMLSIELRNQGLTTLNEVKESYYNLYRWQYFDRVGKYTTDKLGWDTNVSTRPLLCTYTSACINHDVLVIRSEHLVDEMMSFIKRDVGAGGEADSGSHDDRLFAYMIALFTLAHSYQSASLLRELEDAALAKSAGMHTNQPIKDLTYDEGLAAMLERDYAKSAPFGFDTLGSGWMNA